MKQKTAWRAIVQQLVREFRLLPCEPMPVADFKRQFGDEPWRVMLEDRGPQITLEFPNAYRLSASARKQLRDRLDMSFEGEDLRVPVAQRAGRLLEAQAIPVTPRLAGMFALDIAIAGIDKSRAVEEAFRPSVLGRLGLGTTIPGPNEIEVWGDRFSRHAGTDWLMCKPIDRRIRAISFRDEDPKEFPEGYNIQLWDGAHRLQDGLLEFLEGRNAAHRDIERTRNGKEQEHDLHLVRQGRRGRCPLLRRDLSRQRRGRHQSRAQRLSHPARPAM